MFVDTNVLVYAAAASAPFHGEARAALVRHAAAGETFCISRQILREFLAVVTRPQIWASAQATSAAASAALMLPQNFDILEDGVLVWDELTKLCRRFAFGRRQVHDANIVATMLVHAERQLLTFNGANFQRFRSLITLTPLAAP